MKLVILDRDGTLCVEREGYLQSPDDWEPLPGALDAVARLNQAGLQLCTVIGRSARMWSPEPRMSRQ